MILEVARVLCYNLISTDIWKTLRVEEFESVDAGLTNQDLGTVHYDHCDDYFEFNNFS